MNQQLDLQALTAEDFAAHVDRDFVVKLPAGSATWKLQECKRFSVSAGKGFREPFCLNFVSPEPIELGQGMCEFEREGLGTMNVFVVQSSRTEFQVIFN